MHFGSPGFGSPRATGQFVMCLGVILDLLWGKTFPPYRYKGPRQIETHPLKPNQSPLLFASFCPSLFQPQHVIHLLISMTTDGIIDLIANLGHTGDAHALTAPSQERVLSVFC